MTKIDFMNSKAAGRPAGLRGHSETGDIAHLFSNNSDTQETVSYCFLDQSLNTISYKSGHIFAFKTQHNTN